MQRSDPKQQEEEREYDREYKKMQRSDILAWEREREYDTENKREQRANHSFREQGRHYDKLRKQRSSTCEDVQQAVTFFHKAVEESCDYVCTCCDQLWFRSSVVKASYVTCLDEKVKKIVYSGN